MNPTAKTPVPILIVDNDQAKRLALKSVLLPLGYSIVEADSGRAALRCVMVQDFAVILLDVRMPDVDGFETAALIRYRKQSEMTPIIFVTAYASDEIAPSARYVECAVDFLFAPVDPDELRAKVAVFANTFERAESLAQSAREVQASDDQLRLLTDAAPVGIFRTDEHRRYLYTNPRWSTLTGVAAEDAVGKDWDEILATRRKPGVVVDLTSTAETLGDSGSRFEMWLPDSTSRVVLVTSEEIPAFEGRRGGWVGTLADVTVEAEADAARSRFQSLVQNSRDVIAVIDETSKCIYVSPGVTELSGFTPEEVIGESGLAFIHPDDVDVVVSHLANLLANPDASSIVELRTRTRSGEWIWIELRAVNKLADPFIGGVVVNYHDITERRLAADRIAQSSYSLAEAQENSHFGSFTWDLRTGDSVWSDELYRLFGFIPGSIAASYDALVECVHPNDRDRVRRERTNDVAAGTVFEDDFRVVQPDGSVRWLHGRAETITENGVRVRRVGTYQDITARREAEDERALLVEDLGRREALFRGAFHAAQSGIALIAADGMSYVDVNEAFCKMLGYTKDELMALNWMQITHPDDRPVNVRETESLFGGADIINHVRKRYLRKDRETISVDLTDSLVRRPDGTPEYCVTHITDVTEQRRSYAEKEKLQDQLRQAQKMEAVGRLAGGVAHDFNNILAVVLNYAEFVAETLDEDHEGHPDIQEIIGAGRRGAELVHQLLAFSRKEIIQPRVADLNELVDNLKILLSRSVGEDVELLIQPSPDLPLTKVDHGQLEQILLNLVVNARDSMPQGGRITITTSEVNLGANQREGLPAGDYVCLAVTDTGKGIDAETMEHIFEPFFTTKERGGGTGLGLATVYGIVKQAHGGIYARSEAGVETSFTIFLPVTYEEEQPLVPSVVSGPVDEATIMVVEDEEPVRQLIGRILRREGFDVIDVGTGAEALEVCKEHQGNIDLLLTDVVMPQMSGPALRDAARSVRPTMKVLFVSGYTDELIAKRGILDAGDALLNKPFNADELLNRVREVLLSKDEPFSAAS